MFLVVNEQFTALLLAEPEEEFLFSPKQLLNGDLLNGCVCVFSCSACDCSLFCATWPDVCEPK
jgi:hypothetical protein